MGGYSANTGPPLDNCAIDCPLRHALGTINNNKASHLSHPLGRVWIGRVDNQLSVASSCLHLRQQDVARWRAWRGAKRLDRPSSLGSSIPCFDNGDLIGSSAWRPPLGLGGSSSGVSGSQALGVEPPLADNGAQIPSGVRGGSRKTGRTMHWFGMRQTSSNKHTSPRTRRPLCQDGDGIFVSDGRRSHGRKTLQAEKGEMVSSLRGSP